MKLFLKKDISNLWWANQSTTADSEQCTDHIVVQVAQESVAVATMQRKVPAAELRLDEDATWRCPDRRREYVRARKRISRSKCRRTSSTASGHGGSDIGVVLISYST